MKTIGNLIWFLFGGLWMSGASALSESRLAYNVLNLQDLPSFHLER